MAERALGEISDEEEIWLTIRSVLTVTRVAVLLGTIIVSEFFEQYYILDLTVAIWSLIVGIPLFFSFQSSFSGETKPSFRPAHRNKSQPFFVRFLSERDHIPAMSPV